MQITSSITRTILTFVILSVATASRAEDPGTQLTAVQEKVRLGDLTGALQQLEPLLQADDLDQSSKQRIRELAAHILQLRGEEHFRHARIAESIADFDRQLAFMPDQAAGHWQRGISYYYTGEFAKGARQFKLHQTANPEDVENAFWHFLCVVRSPNGSIDAARHGLILVTRDSRIPMAEIQKMIAGTLTPEDVLQAVEHEGDAAKFYADLYVGLFYEALDRDKECLRFIKRAADNPAAQRNYMGDVARVHLLLRNKSAKPNQRRGVHPM